MSQETLTQVEFHHNNEPANSSRSFDFLDLYRFSFEYVKDFVRPRDDWFKSQYLYELFNKREHSESAVNSIQIGVPGLIQTGVPVSIQTNIPAPSVEMSSQKSCSHLRDLDLDLEAISVRMKCKSLTQWVNNSFFDKPKKMFVSKEGSCVNRCSEWRNFPHKQIFALQSFNGSWVALFSCWIQGLIKSCICECIYKL